MKKVEYLNPDSTQTLREGMAELCAAEGSDGGAAENVAPDLPENTDLLDAIHVLFACPTNLASETAAHVWTAFGTTLRMREMHRVNGHQDHRSVFENTWASNPVVFRTSWYWFTEAALYAGLPTERSLAIFAHDAVGELA